MSPNTVLARMFFLFLLVNAVHAAAIGRGEQFWTSTEVEAVSWREGCLIAETCKDPRIEIALGLPTMNEVQLTSWSRHDEASGRVINSYWSHSFPEDLIFSSEVVGEDPKYGFMRSCDMSDKRRVFGVNQQDVDPLNPEGKIITLQARCYNVTLRVRKFTARCPWCPEEVVKVEMQSASLFNESNSSTIMVILVSVTVVSAALALIQAIVSCRRRTIYSRTNSTIASSFYVSPGRARTVLTTVSSPRPSLPSFSPSPPTTSLSSSVVIREDDGYYEEISDDSRIYEEQAPGVAV